MTTQKKAYLFAFSAIGLWSTIGSAFKITLRYVDPVPMLLISSFVACLVLAAFLSVQRKWKLLRNYSARQILMSALLGLLNPFLYYVVLLKAYDLLPAQVAGTLNYIWPLMLVLLSIPILHQKISAGSVTAIMISFAGIMMISGIFSGHNPEIYSISGWEKTFGISLALSSAIFWAFYWIFNMKDPREETGKLFLNFCFGFLYTALYYLTMNDFTLLPWQGVAGSIYVGLFEMGITFLLWMNALKYSATTAKVSNLIYLSPFISLIIIHFAVGETILLTTIVGLALIVSGILLQQYRKS